MSSSAMRRLAILSLLAALVAAGRPAAQRTSVIDQLDRYAAGQFPIVVEELRRTTDFNRILDTLRREGPAWIGAAGPEHKARRELAAATFALEAARAGAWIEWKLLQEQPPMCAGRDCVQLPTSVLYWKAPPLLIEWGCQLLRSHAAPRPVERWWQLAALAVAQRSEDPAFLIGDPAIGAGLIAGEIMNTQDEIKHLDHAASRFPRESRFVLAQGIARDRVWPDQAAMAYRALAGDPDVAGEATLRLGALLMPPPGRSNYMTRGAGTARLPTKPDEAIQHFERAETLTRDPYVVYLSRYFKGRVFEHRGRTVDAEAAYRGAVATVPHAQAATVALGTLLFRTGRRSEAQQLIAEMLARPQRAGDPWRTFVHADDRFWPQLVGRLREEILR